MPMLAAIGSESCLTVTSCALAPMARLQANASVAAPIVVLIMTGLLVPATASWRNGCGEGGLVELVLDLVDAGLGADLILVAAWGAGDADRADRLLANHDRQRAARGCDIGEEQLSGHRVLPDVLGELAGRDPERARRVGLLPGIFERVDPGGVMAEPDQHFAVAAD